MNKKPIKIVALSDLHGILPPSSSIPKCDLILIGGDICGCHSILDQSIWLYREFLPWLTNLPAEKIIGVAGNHDFIWEKAPHLVPKLPWIYLQDNSCEFKGWTVYGSPWSGEFFDWAFMDKEIHLERRWQNIPDNTNILITHGPPYGFGDAVTRKILTGSPSLIRRVLELRDLKLHVFGHIHEGRGVWKIDGKTLANVTILDENYKNIHKPFLFELEPDVEG